LNPPRRIARRSLCRSVPESPGHPPPGASAWATTGNHQSPLPPSRPQTPPPPRCRPPARAWSWGTRHAARGRRGWAARRRPAPPPSAAHNRRAVLRGVRPQLDDPIPGVDGEAPPGRQVVLPVPEVQRPRDPAGHGDVELDVERAGLRAADRQLPVDVDGPPGG